MLEARAGARNPVPSFAFGGQPDDVEHAAFGEIGDGTGVIDADDRVAGQRVVGKVPEIGLLAADRVRADGQVVDAVGQVSGEGADEAAGDQQARGAELGTQPRKRVADRIGQCGQADEPRRSERPQVAQAIPEKAVVAGRDQHSEAHRDHSRSAPPPVASKAGPCQAPAMQATPATPRRSEETPSSRCGRRAVFRTALRGSPTRSRRSARRSGRGWLAATSPVPWCSCSGRSPPD